MSITYNGPKTAMAESEDSSNRPRLAGWKCAGCGETYKRYETQEHDLE